MALKLSRLDGSNGFRLDGVDEFDFSGASVAGAGDVNGDGVDDLIIGAHSADPDGRDTGASYVVFGSVEGIEASLDLAALDGANGFRLDGIEESDSTGTSVAGAGDVNGDGIDDLVVGAVAANPDGRLDAGQGYVVFGSVGGFAGSLDLSALDGSNGFRLGGLKDFDNNGIVAGAGDVNGDGIDDLIVGAPAADPGGREAAGETYVLFGSAGGFGASLDLSGLDGTNGFRLDGISAGDLSGAAVAGAGDVNGDGIGDLIVGTPFVDPGGESYVVFGSAAGFAASLDLSALSGSNGFRLNGAGRNAASGRAVAGAGDVNGDNIDDLIIGAPGFDPGGREIAGASFVVFGSAGTSGASLDVSALDGTNGFRIEGINQYDRAGWSVAGAGDVNGDGIDDLIIGASGFGEDEEFRESYLVFGTAAGFEANLELSALNGANGFRLDDGGFAVAGAGDVNGDGIDDLITGAPGAEPGGRNRAGESYVVFGSRQLGGANDAPEAADDLLRVGTFDVVDLAGDNGSGFDLDPDFDDLTVTEIDGTPVAAGDVVTLASGVRVEVLDATEVRFDAPGVALGTALSDTFVYEISDGRGGSDTATVSVDYVQDIGPPPIPDAPPQPARQPGSSYRDNDGDIRFLPFPGTQYTDNDGDVRFRPVGQPYRDNDGDIRYDEGHYAREPVPAAGQAVSGSAPDFVTTGDDAIRFDDTAGDAPTIADFIL